MERGGRLLRASLYWFGAMSGALRAEALCSHGCVPPCCWRSLRQRRHCPVYLTVSQGAGVIAAGCAISSWVEETTPSCFPTIFTPLTLERSSMLRPAAATSGLLCVAITGGAVLPRIAGKIADAYGRPARGVPAAP